MAEEFKLWSEVSAEASCTLKPLIELRGWEELSAKEKTTILKHYMRMGWLKDREDLKKFARIAEALNDKYKVQTYAKEYFSHGGPHFDAGFMKNCCLEVASIDVLGLIKNGDKDIALETLSMYAKALSEEEKSVEAGKLTDFDKFINATNNLFDDFSVNLTLTRTGLQPRQERLVQEYVQDPLIRALADKKWEPVQKEFNDAVNEYNKGTKESYSHAITHLVSGVQAFLQLTVKGKIGLGDIDALINKGMKDGLIPNDNLSKKVLLGISSTLMEIRQKNGDAHPKAEYANEKSARMVLNISAVFIQHCINHSQKISDPAK
jgi:hypothetical protein